MANPSGKGNAFLVATFSNVAHLLTHYCMLIYPTAVLALEQALGLSYGELISLSLAGFLLYGAAALPAGALGDRWSTLGMLGVLFFGLGGSALYTGFAESPLQIAIGLALMGACAAIYHPVGMSMIVHTAESRARALGINGVFGGTGVALAPICTAFLSDGFGWKAAFWTPGVLALATGGLYLLALAAGRLDVPSVAARTSRPVSTRAIWQAGVVLMVTMLCMGLVYRVISVGMPKIFAVRVTEFGQTGALGIGGMVTFVFLVQGFAQYAGGVLADRYPPKLIYRLSFLLQLPLLLLAASLFNVPMLLASALLVLVNVAGMPAENVLVAEYAPPRWRATTYGVKFVMSLGVSSLGVGLLAVIHEATGEFVWLLVVLAGLSLLGFGATLFLPREEHQPAPLPATVPGFSERA